MPRALRPRQTSMLRRALVRKPSHAREILAKHIGQILVQKGIVSKVFISGSAANLVATPQSDIDLLVTKATSRKTIQRIASQFQARFRVPIHVIFLKDIQETGTRLHDPLVNTALLVAGGTQAEQESARNKRAQRRPFIPIKGGAYERYKSEVTQLARMGQWTELQKRLQHQPIVQRLIPLLNPIIDSKLNT